MAKVCDVLEFLLEKAPEKLKMEQDNVGLLVGECENEIQKILVSLDITADVIDEAEKMGAGLIVSHHPVFFGLKRITDDEIAGKRAIRLIKKGIAAICMHTNLDVAEGGVNDALAERLCLTDTEILASGGISTDGKEYGIGRTGYLKKPLDFSDFLFNVKRALGAEGLRYLDAGRPVKKVAVGGGTCGDYMDRAIKTGCDTFVTADIKHSLFIEAREYGINLIDAGHFCTEDVICERLVDMLKEKFPEITVRKSGVNEPPMKFYM